MFVDEPRSESTSLPLGRAGKWGEYLSGHFTWFDPHCCEEHLCNIRITLLGYKKIRFGSAVGSSSISVTSEKMLSIVTESIAINGKDLTEVFRRGQTKDRFIWNRVHRVGEKNGSSPCWSKSLGKILEVSKIKRVQM